MKIQNLAVIFIIIMLPISMVLTVYVQNQVQTLQLQISYDFKLTNATYDALKAFQLNTVNSGSSDLANSKIRDIQASVNTFFNSIAKNFNMVGYNKDILQEFVPALVYTMYDGYYIYAPFYNKIYDKDTSEDAKYQIGDKIYDLKPYVHYSCRYVHDNIDVVITYTLDNCITVEGTINGDAVYKTGYLIDNISGSGNNIKYRNVSIINGETITENLKAYVESDDGKYQAYENSSVICDKVNGVKYYKDDTGWFSILTNTVHRTAETFDEVNTSGIEYYQNAQKFTDWVRTNLGDLTTGDAVDEEGNPLDVFGANVPIFEKETGKSIEDENSLFNQHRLAVIRYSIEKNLSISIANYNSFSGAGTNFQMPKLKEDEWEKILNNVSIISFMQGLSIGGKVYNGYSIVTNTKTEEVVNTDAIYITTSDGYYHRVTDKDFEGSASNVTGAYFNIDFERKETTDGSNALYYYPHQEYGSYSSIVNQTGANSPENIYEYVASLDSNIAQIYFTALGRERFSMFRTNQISTDWD